MRDRPLGTVRPARFAGPASGVVPGVLGMPRMLMPRMLAMVCALAWLLAPNAVMAGVATADDHQQAVAALADVKAAVAELVQADATYAADPNVYHRAAHRAINALTGTQNEGYVASAGTPGDPAGAIGHIDSLLDRTATPVWASALQSAEANTRAAVNHLQDAAKADELMDYVLAASRALAYLEVARGRPNESGVFGGLEGALADTDLGIPAGARQEDACHPPAAAPGYGTHGGYIAWVALPAGDGTHELAEASGATSLSVQGGMIVLPTAAAKLVADACARHAKADPPDPQSATGRSATGQAATGQSATGQSATGQSATGRSATGQSATGQPATGQSATGQSATGQPATGQPATGQPATGQAATGQAATEQSATKQFAMGEAVAAQTAAAQHPTQAPGSAGGAPPALYTKAQAAQGMQIFATKCVACHGANLQGTAAPSVAGNDFLATANHNGWTLAIMRYIVFQLMPRNSPASLSPQDNADVMAFLLASNCFPAGAKPFPSNNDPSFGNIELGPVAGQHPGENAKGVCAVE